MRAFYFLQIDNIMSKAQGKVMWLFIIIALALSIVQGNPYWGPLYMVFGSMILSTTPFTLSQSSNHGFLLMLPATIKDRVAGRFGYGLSLLAMALFFGGIGTILTCIVKDITLSSLFFVFYIAIAASGLIMLSIQYTIFYVIGELKSVQLMGVIRMIPGFLLFIIGSIGMDLIQEGAGMGTAYSWLVWVGNHLMECALLMLLVGIVIFFAGIFVSVQIQKKRDFA